MSNQVLNYLKELEAKALEREKEKLSLSRSLCSLPSTKAIIITDSREQVNSRYLFPGYLNHVAMLQSGDYSISPYEHLVSIERKSLDDLVNTLIHNKERFKNELERLRTYETKCILIESSYSDLLLGKYVSKALPQSVIGLLHSACYHNSIPGFFLGDFQTANRFALKYLLCYARKKENHYSFPAPLRPLEIGLEQTVLSYSLDEFIKEVTVNKIDFKYYVNQLKAYPSSAIVLECSYQEIINKPLGNTTLEDIIVSLLVDHNIHVYFMQSKEIAQIWINNHLKRYKDTPIKEKKKRGKG